MNQTTNTQMVLNQLDLLVPVIPCQYDYMTTYDTPMEYLRGAALRLLWLGAAPASQLQQFLGLDAHELDILINQLLSHHDISIDAQTGRCELTPSAKLRFKRGEPVIEVEELRKATVHYDMVTGEALAYQKTSGQTGYGLAIPVEQTYLSRDKANLLFTQQFKRMVETEILTGFDPAKTSLLSKVTKVNIKPKLVNRITLNLSYDPNTGETELIGLDELDSRADPIRDELLPLLAEQNADANLVWATSLIAQLPLLAPLQHLIGPNGVDITGLMIQHATHLNKYGQSPLVVGALSSLPNRERVGHAIGDAQRRLKSGRERPNIHWYTPQTPLWGATLSVNELDALLDATRNPIHGFGSMVHFPLVTNTAQIKSDTQQHLPQLVPARIGIYQGNHVADLEILMMSGQFAFVVLHLRPDAQALSIPVGVFVDNTDQLVQLSQFIDEHYEAVNL